MRIIAFAVFCILSQIGLSAAAAWTFALGEMRQATAAAPREYVVEVDVVADGYSTFRANIVGGPDAMRLIRRWESVEREQGVDVVITLQQPIATPRIITLTAQYQGRERTGEILAAAGYGSAEGKGHCVRNSGKPGKGCGAWKDPGTGKNRAGMPVPGREERLFDGERGEVIEDLRV